MATFLTLIPEIRHTILELTLYFPVEVPQSFNDVSNRTPATLIKSRTWSRFHDVLYTPFNRTDLIPLLLVNKQLHLETLAAIERIPTKHSYILDIVLYNETSLLPTWLYLPELSTDVDSIHATIRYIGMSPTGDNAFRGADGSPPLLYWMLFSLLENILCGNVIGNKLQTIGVKHLEIDIETPTETQEMKNLRLEYEDARSKAHLARQPMKVMKPRLMDSRRVVQAVTGGITRMLFMWRDAKQYGKVLYESLDVVHVKVDGKMHREWKMGDVLDGMDGESYGRGEEDDREEFRIWKKSVVQRRIDRGLSMGRARKEER